MASKDPERRRTAAAAGGLGRAAALNPEQRADVSRAGAAAVNSPAALARRIVKRWPELGRVERAEIRTILAPLMPRPRPAKDTAPTTE